MLRSRAWLMTIVIGLCAAADSRPALAQTTDLTKLSLEDLLQTQVSVVSQADQALLRTAASVYVIARGDIVRSGADTLPDLLRVVPGLWVAQIDATSWHITSRGTDALLVLIDGHLAASPLFGELYWDMLSLPLREIERVEVVRGASGTSWGVNGVATVINVVTRSWEGAAGGLLTGGGGSSQHGLTTARYVGPMRNGGHYRVHGSYARHGTPRVVAGTDNPDLAMVGLGDVRLQWNGATDVIGVHASLQRGETSHLFARGATPPQRESLAFTDGNAAASWRRQLSNRSELTVQGQYRAFGRAGDRSHERWQVGDGDVRWRRAIGDRQAVMTGIGYRFALATLEPGPSVASRSAEERIHTFSGFVHDEIEIANGWHLTPGSTFEHDPYTGFEAQPTIRMTWRPTAAQALWWAASHGVGPAWRIAPDPLLPEIDAAFRAQRVRDYEAGYRVQVGRTSIDAVAFVTRRDPRDIPVTTSTEHSARGAEVAASWRPFAWWGLSGSYGALRLAVREPGDATSATATGWHVPQHQAQLRTVFELPRDMKINAELFRVSGTDAGRVAGYTKIDIRFEYEIGKRLEASIGARNLLHGGDREFSGDALRHVIPVRTNVFAELEWEF